MGTYTTLSLSGFDLVSSKSRVIPEVMTVFQERDRAGRWISMDDGQVVAAPGQGEDVMWEVYYEVSAEVACQRLDIMGFSLERSKREYDEIRRAEIDGMREADEHNNDVFYVAKVRELEHRTFERYVEALRVIIALGQRHRLPEETFNELDAVSQYLLKGEHDEWPLLGFLCHDVRSFMRAALSTVDPRSTLRQDVSELISSGWADHDERIRDNAVETLVARYPENAPRIVLTEGSSDADILAKSLAVLFPHLVGYFSFFDFHGSKAAGGASQLISVVKAFAAAGVANRVVALLDNDTAAHEAARSLRNITLPANIAVVHCPARDWLRQYPTLGPSGDVALDVNGKAGSLELYLGRDVLAEDGALCPVQWAGYSQAMRAYQGELINKSGVSERWRAKAERCLTDPTQIDGASWEDLRFVWEQIFDAFPSR